MMLSSGYRLHGVCKVGNDKTRRQYTPIRERSFEIILIFLFVIYATMELYHLIKCASSSCVRMYIVLVLQHAGDEQV